MVILLVLAVACIHLSCTLLTALCALPTCCTTPPGAFFSFYLVLLWPASTSASPC